MKRNEMAFAASLSLHYTLDTTRFNTTLDKMKIDKSSLDTLPQPNPFRPWNCTASHFSGRKHLDAFFAKTASLARCLLMS